jgi:exopolysaccharide biosynthesis polyprenyl glycosylphosphotransferase
MNSLFGRLAAGRVARLSVMVDIFVLLLAVGASGYLAGSRTLQPSLTWLGASCLAAWLFTSMVLRHYDPWAADRQAYEDAAMTSIHIMAVTSVLAIATLSRQTGLPNVSVFLLMLWPTALVIRFAVFRTLSERTAPIDEVLIVGIGPLGRATADELARRGRQHVLGFVRYGNETATHRVKGQVLGEAKELEAVLRKVPVGEVYLASHSFAHGEEMQACLKVCERFGVPFALPATLFRLDRARPMAAHGLTDGFIHYQSVLHKPTQMAFKRAFDMASSAFALVVLSPMLITVAFLVKFTSKGPILFKQKRVGMHGRPFEMLKFRTMVQNAEELKAKLAAQNEMDGPVFKMKHDPRITRIGRWLRKFSVDELPQLINVLRGDMSVVGPRPPVPNEVAKYEAWQRRRLSVRPGLTCIWQVSGRNEISFEEWMYMDLQYIDTWSFSKDIELILRTFPVVLTGRGAS